MSRPAEPIAPTVNSKVMTSTGLAAFACPVCHQWLCHAPRPGLVKALCGATVQLRIEGDLSESEAAAVRRSLKSQTFRKGAPSAMR
jgi:hypothetical protein